VLARFYGNRTAWWLPTPPTFTLGGGCLAAELRLDDDQRVIGTDESWLSQEPAAWTPSAPLHSISPQIPEVFDARRLPRDWTLPEFDDADWSKSHPIPSLHIGGTGRRTPPSDPYGPSFRGRSRSSQPRRGVPCDGRRVRQEWVTGWRPR
jgi:alpha-L-rhamnosidase